MRNFPHENIGTKFALKSPTQANNTAHCDYICTSETPPINLLSSYMITSLSTYLIPFSNSNDYKTNEYINAFFPPFS